MSVPRKLHQIWIGSHMSSLYAGWTKRMKQMNPDWEYRLWGNDLLERYADDPFVAWMQATNERKAFLVDRLRVLLLRDEGGLYADTDCYPVRPLRMLDEVWNDPTVDFVAGMRSPDRQGVTLGAPGIPLVDNTVLASEKDGWMANRLCALYRPNSRKHTGLSQGREILRNAGPATRLLSYGYFYATENNQNAIMLHDGHNNFSWGKPEPQHVPIPR